MSEYVTLAAECAELILAGVGCALLWRHVISPTARTKAAPAQLRSWDVPLVDFLFYLFYVIGGGLLGGIVSLVIVKPLGLTGDAAAIASSTAGQLGLLGGVVLYHFSFKAPVPSSPPARSSVLLSGITTFLMALPLLIATSKLSEFLLRAAGLPAEKQDVVEMFLRIKSPLLLGLMALLAVVIAPITEELVFRAGFFRYLRTRLPYGLGFLLPALIFAALHVQWSTLANLSSFAPLTVLALLFSKAYERSGRIGTSMVAHALFNLNTILLILAGISA